MIDDITAAIDSLRPLVPEFDRAWYAAQRGDSHPVADELAVDVVAVLEALAREAAPDIIALGLNPDDRDALRNGVTDPAVSFYLQCYEARATFRYWADEGDFDAQLGAVELAAHKWLTSGNPSPDAAELRSAKAQAAMAELKRRSQQSGNTRKAADRKARKAAAWAVFGLDKPSGPSLIARLKTATPEQLERLAEIYGYRDAVTFERDAGDRDTALRKQLQRDNRK
ncbi:hypothetical protein [Ruegeria sp. HKCCSP351]|uniref:hypothetical protein n=1 Tax=Ruegeria sp. HKCCSP351 TaxID=2794832 RepID=UPI001AE9A5D6|nr:hypothetical protein [Ruegeria sp. HKCCSP351]